MNTRKCAPCSSIICLQAAHLPMIMQAEEKCFGENAWSGFTIAETIDSAHSYYQGIIDGCTLCAYLCVRVVSGEAEILSIGTVPECRGQGLASMLMKNALCELKERGVREAFLEVRAGNQAAISLYRKLGFEDLGRRRKYYQHPLEDALVMRLRLASPSPGVVGSEAQVTNHI